MTKKRKRRTAQQWAEIVERWRAGGQSAEAFAEVEGCHPKTLAWWARRLGDGDRGAACSAARFAPVRVVGSPRGAASGSVTVLHDSGFSITVDGGTDAILLRTVLMAVRAC